MMYRGAPTDGDESAGPNQPADVLDAWIGDLLGELQGARAQRLVQLCLQLQADVFDWEIEPLARALAYMNSAGRQLSFLPLHRGWLARLLGRHRAAYELFMAAHARMADCASHVTRLAAEPAAGGRERQPAPARGVLEQLETQRRALNAAIDQAVGWLQDMCTQLASARAAGDENSRLDVLAERAQGHTQALKHLQAAGTIVQDVTGRGLSVVERRAALLDKVRAGLQEFDANWTQRLDCLLADLRANRDAVRAIPQAIEAHNDFMKRLAASVDACGALQHEERLLAEHVAMLMAHLGEGPA